MTGAVLANIRPVTAWITGQHSYYLDPDDPWQAGYMLSDTWGVTPTLKQ